MKLVILVDEMYDKDELSTAFSIIASNAEEREIILGKVEALKNEDGRFGDYVVVEVKLP